MSTVELPRFEIFYWNFKKSLTFRLKRIIQKIVANVIAEVSSARDEIFFEKDMSFIFFFFIFIYKIFRITGMDGIVISCTLYFIIYFYDIIYTIFSIVISIRIVFP